METDPEPATGVLASLRRLLDAALSIARNRVELLAVEVNEEAQRWLETFLLAAALAAVGTLALAMISLTIVIACAEEHRLAVLVGLSVFYVVAAFVLGWRLRLRWKKSSPFAATIGELKKDKACLEEKPDEQAATAKAGPDSGK